VCWAVSGLLTWYRADVTSGANGSGLLSDLHVFSLARVRLSLDNVVGTATRYGLEGSWIESRWGRDFSHLSTPAPRLTQSSVQWVPGLCPGQGGQGVVLTTHPHPGPRYAERSRAIPLLCPKRPSRPIRKG
jgi:hypothetical protein